MLFGEEGSDVADDWWSGGEDADDVGAMLGVPVASFSGRWARSDAGELPGTGERRRTVGDVVNARSDRVRASGGRSGKYEPVRTFGIMRSMLPVRVFLRRER